MIRFSRYLWLYACISGLVLVPGIFSLIRYGLHPSIDFTGGTLLEVSYDTPPAASDVLSATKTNTNTYIFRIKPGDPVNVAGQGARVLRSEMVGPVLGRELLVKASVASGMAIFGIFFYVAWAFKNIKFGASAIIALIHDLLVMLGTFSLFGLWWGAQADTLFVTAFLTTMSFSIHDTIVVFDRIREYGRRDDRTPFDQIADRALGETMSRSLVNSFTIVFMLLALLLMGGVTIRWFVAALMVGTISGTYSSPFVATPILILWDRWEKRKSTPDSRRTRLG
jgi:preprotein translocase subunit SecF